MLYDGVERFLRQAEVVMGEGDVAQAHDRMQRAEAIINELLRTLDKSAGQVAERLEAIYVFCKRLMMEARLERDATKLTKAPPPMAGLPGPGPSPPTAPPGEHRPAGPSGAP